MTIAEKIAEELNWVAPDWNWDCTEKPCDSRVLIAPIRVKISASHKETSAKTIPIEVSCLTSTNLSETAVFVCQILMIATPGGSRAKALLVE
ncbi:MAG: hypothetical protein JWM68_4221 [Verrucomicrobiales bacterium]|nr:hypothetical protein [Verrucomicrobiales bacterium]